MQGIPPHLLKAIQTALMQCDEIHNPAQLRAVFTADALRPWQAGLPEADNARARVDLIINYLRDKRRNSGESALVLLLQVLSERYDPEDERSSLLFNRAYQLEHHLQAEAPAPAAQPRMRNDPAPLSAMQRHRLERERQSRQAEWDVLHEKSERIRQALRIETDPSRIFQYEQQLVTAQNELETIEQKLVAIEQQLQTSDPPAPPTEPSLPPDPPAWNTEAIRGMLNAAFNDGELTTLCFDFFRPVYEDFSGGMSKGDKIQRLLDYCNREDLLEKLVALVKEKRPAQYQKFAEQIRG